MYLNTHSHTRTLDIAGDLILQPRPPFLRKLACIEFACKPFQISLFRSGTEPALAPLARAQCWEGEKLCRLRVILGLGQPSLVKPLAVLLHNQLPPVEL